MTQELLTNAVAVSSGSAQDSFPMDGRGFPLSTGCLPPTKNAG